MIETASMAKPRYRDGTPAAVGDHVRGIGYNFRGTDRRPAVITGVVVALQSEEPSSNITVAHAVPSGHPRQLAKIDLEYGQADQFDRV